MNKEQLSLIEKIEQAFADTLYPGDDNLIDQNHCGECYELYEQFKGKTWQTLTDIEFLHQSHVGLSLFKAEAFRYYLPAFMRAVLVDHDTAGIVEDSIIFHLTPPEEGSKESQEWLMKFGQSKSDYFLNKIRGITAEQISVIHEYLTQRTEIVLFDDEVEKQRILDFWSDPNL